MQVTPHSLHSSDIATPASRRATNCSLSSIAEHSFHGILAPSPKGESVTHVSGTMCYLCSGRSIRVTLVRLQSSLRGQGIGPRSEEHTSELQSHSDLVCRLLLEKKKHK